MAIKIFIKTNDDSSFLFKNEANPGFVAKPKTYELELVPTQIRKHKADEIKEYTVRCINLYTKNVLFEAVKVNEIDVNGTVYTDYATLSAALAGLVFKKGGGSGSGAPQIQSDWNQVNQSALDFIKNKPELDTLESVVNRGNYSPKKITFTGSTNAPTDDGSLGMNENTYSMYFGNMNPSHTGVYNLSFGYGALQNITTGSGNTSLGHYSIGGLTTGQYNTFIGYSSGYNFSNTSKVVTGNVNVSIGNSSMADLTSGYKNIAMGQSAMAGLTTGAYNVALGQSSMQFLTTNNKNIGIGSQTGAYVRGENNVFIGTGAGRSNTVSTVETVNNRLVIHSNVNLTPNPSIGTENPTDYTASHTNGLIIGDFSQRWVKFNGGFSINPTYIPNAQGDSTYTKTIVAKPDGTFGWKNKVSLPTKRPSMARFTTNDSSFTDSSGDFISLYSIADITYNVDHTDVYPSYLLYAEGENPGITYIKNDNKSIYFTELLTGRQFYRPGVLIPLVSKGTYVVSVYQSSLWINRIL